MRLTNSLIAAALSLSLSQAAPTTTNSTQSGSSGSITWSLVSTGLSDNSETSSKVVSDSSSGTSTSCYNSGAWMPDSQLTSGISTWCQSQDGLLVPKGKTISAEYQGLVLDGGQPAYFVGTYSNTQVATGWKIVESECTYYMGQAVNACQGKSQNSQGGTYSDSTLGSVTVDPNAV